jgi:2-isopropylmalate synthase
MLKNVETFEIMRPRYRPDRKNIASGQAFRPRALRAKLKELGFDLADNQLNDVFVRFKALADRKKEVYDDDLIALVKDEQTNDAYEYLQLKKLRVICGTDGPQEADMILTVDGVDHHIDATGDGPVDAAFNCVKMLFPHKARLQVYQVHAVTEGTDAQATVSVKIEEDGRIATGQSADTARKTHAEATSPGRPGLPVGLRLPAAISRAVADPVAIQPGKTALQVMPSPAFSSAVVRVSPVIAAFAAE